MELFELLRLLQNESIAATAEENRQAIVQLFHSLGWYAIIQACFVTALVIVVLIDHIRIDRLKKLEKLIETRSQGPAK